MTKKQAYSDHLIKHIKNETLPVRHFLPAIKELASDINYKVYTLTEALKLMEYKQYLIIKKGKKSMTWSPGLDDYAMIKPEVTFHGNSHCLQSFGLTSKLDSDFKRDKSHNLKISFAGEQNAIWERLLQGLAERHNAQQNVKLSVANMYYTHNLHILMSGIASTLELIDRVVILPETGYEFIACIFHSRGIKIKKVKVESDGYNREELMGVFAQFDVGAIINMSKENYPFGVDTSSANIRLLLNFYKVDPFYIIEVNLGGPSQLSKKNLLLEMAGDDMKDVIYVWQPDFSQLDSSQIRAVTSSPENIKNIRDYVKDAGKNAFESIGYATSEMFRRPGYALIQGDIMQRMLKFKKIVTDVFGECGFWKLDGIFGDSQDSICLIPLVGILPTDTFDQLKVFGIIAVDPGIYTRKGEENIACIRFEMGHYVEIRNCKKLLMWVNEKCMALVIDCPLVVFD